MDQNMSANSEMSSPKVTVLMPVYNAAPFLREAIDSILQQTFRDFEFLIVNDGSTDNSGSIIQSFNDGRIKYINLPENGGIIHALNLGLSEAKGKYIARMDADDISAPERLEKQVRFMDGHPEVGVCGAWVKYFGGRSGVVRNATTHEQIMWSMPMGSPFFHPTVMLRSDLGVRYPQVPHAEDYALWVSLLGQTKFANLPEVLLHYRSYEQSVSVKHSDAQKRHAADVRRLAMKTILKRDISDKEYAAVERFGQQPMDVPMAIKVLEQINDSNNLFGRKELVKQVASRIIHLLQQRKEVYGVMAIYFWLLRRMFVDMKSLYYMALIFSIKRLREK
jgi:glycosyltransferase involved in cell wall biosynthesis